MAHWPDCLRRDRLAPLPMLIALTGLLLASGCRSAPVEPIDARLQYETQAALLALQEDLPAEAETRYRLAVKRAWALDDPTEIAANSYNLAVALFVQERYDEARGWLLESREEFHRAGQPASAVWLLEAKIARKQERFGEAECYARHVIVETRTDWTDGCEAACQCVVSKTQTALPFLNKQLPGEGEVLTAEAWLLQANVALDQGQLGIAWGYLEQCHASQKRCRKPDPGIQAGIAHVQARLCWLQGQPAQAGHWHLQEAGWRRESNSCHELQRALESAAEAYLAAGETTRAVGCHYRLARIHYGRDRFEPALRQVHRCLELLEGWEHPAWSARVSLVFAEINAAHQAALREAAEREGASPASSQPIYAEPQLAPAESVPHEQPLLLPAPEEIAPPSPSVEESAPSM